MVTAFAILEMFYRQTNISKNEKQKSTDDVRHGQLNVWLAIRFSGPWWQCQGQSPYWQAWSWSWSHPPCQTKLWLEARSAETRPRTWFLGGLEEVQADSEGQDWDWGIWGGRHRTQAASQPSQGRRTPSRRSWWGCLRVHIAWKRFLFEETCRARWWWTSSPERYNPGSQNWWFWNPQELGPPPKADPQKFCQI